MLMPTLRCAFGSLGLSSSWMAAKLNVSPRTVNYWVEGRSKAPHKAIALVESVEAMTIDYVNAHVTRIDAWLAANEGAKGCILVAYRNQADMKRVSTEAADMPHTWYDRVLAEVRRRYIDRGVQIDVKDYVHTGTVSVPGLVL